MIAILIKMNPNWCDGALTGFIRVVVIGVLLFLRWRSLLVGRRSTEGSRLPLLLSYSSRSHLARRSCSKRGTCKCIQSSEPTEHNTTLHGCNICSCPLSKDYGLLLTLLHLYSPCWAIVADAVCDLELWTGTIFFTITGLP